MQILGFDDSKKIGMVLFCLALLLEALAVILFFHRTLLVVANLMFLAGIYFFVGFATAIAFFLKSGKRTGSGLYFAGLLLVLLHFAFFGTVVQLVGVFFLFKSFVPACCQTLRDLPVVGRLFDSQLARQVSRQLDSSYRYGGV